MILSYLNISANQLFHYSEQEEYQMFTVLFFLIGGMLIGILLHKRPWLPKVSERLSGVIIYLLLFTLGLKAGSDKAVMGRLDTLGLTALEISICTVMGSVITAWVVYTYVLKKTKE